MSKPNKMGMSDKQRRESRAARYRTPEKEEAENRRNREMNPEFYALMDAVASGEMTPDEAAKALSGLQSQKEE